MPPIFKQVISSYNNNNKSQQHLSIYAGKYCLFHFLETVYYITEYVAIPFDTYISVLVLQPFSIMLLTVRRDKWETG